MKNDRGYDMKTGKYFNFLNLKSINNNIILQIFFRQLVGRKIGRMAYAEIVSLSMGEIYFF
jgi:hypothetical protein